MKEESPISDTNYLKKSDRVESKVFDEHTIEFAKTVNLVQFCPFENSYDILACCSQQHLSIFRIIFKETSVKDEVKFMYEFIHDYVNGSNCTSLAFSPRTNFSDVKNSYLQFAIAGEDFSILASSHRFVENNLVKNDSVQQYISGHSDYINDLQFEPVSGDLLASTSDDCSFCVWSIDEGNEKVNLQMKVILSSPAINVRWHNAEPKKVGCLPMSSVLVLIFVPKAFCFREDRFHPVLRSQFSSCCHVVQLQSLSTHVE